jgi:hypothetical protein
MHVINVFLPPRYFSMQPTHVPSRDLDPSKNNVHILGSPFFGSMEDFKFSNLFELLGLMELVSIYNISLEIMLGCTLEVMLV